MLKDLTPTDEYLTTKCDAATKLKIIRRVLK